MRRKGAKSLAFFASMFKSGWVLPSTVLYRYRCVCMCRMPSPSSYRNRSHTYKTTNTHTDDLGEPEAAAINGVALLARAGGCASVRRPGEGCRGGQRAASTQWLDNGCARSLIRAAPCTCQR